MSGGFSELQETNCWETKPTENLWEGWLFKASVSAQSTACSWLSATTTPEFRPIPAEMTDMSVFLFVSLTLFPVLEFSLSYKPGTLYFKENWNKRKPPPGCWQGPSVNVVILEQTRRGQMKTSGGAAPATSAPVWTDLPQPRHRRVN